VFRSEAAKVRRLQKQIEKLDDWLDGHSTCMAREQRIDDLRARV
jgi:hypothetical protein